MLVSRGNREVILSVTRNEGARFSDSGYSALVHRSIYDDVLAVCVGLRKDIPREHFHTLISNASRVVFEKLVAANPESVREVQEVLTGITGQDVAAAPKRIERRRKFDILRRSGRPPDAIVHEFAASRPPRRDDRGAGRALPHAARTGGKRHCRPARRQRFPAAAGPRRRALVADRARDLHHAPGPNGMPQQDIEAARRNFEKLRADTAQRVISFYNERHSAFANFQQLAEHIDDKDTTPRFARPAQAS